MEAQQTNIGTTAGYLAPGYLEPMARMGRDLRQAARKMTADEARYLVDTYYQMQEQRKRAANQVRSMENEPHETLAWVRAQAEMLENQIKAALDQYSGASPVGVWARSQVGIGPVIAAGLLAHIDLVIRDEEGNESGRRNTAGAVWSFAGLNPTARWDKGKKRPWNASLKTLCWKIGESFVKTCNHEASFYGKLYAQRKELETERNERGEFGEQAAAKLERFKIGKDTEAYAAYSAGKLPKAHIHERSKRWAVKLFLAHFHHVLYRHTFGEEPPKPYVISVLGHGDFIAPPA